MERNQFFAQFRLISKEKMNCGVWMLYPEQDQMELQKWFSVQYIGWYHCLTLQTQFSRKQAQNVPFQSLKLSVFGLVFTKTWSINSSPCLFCLAEFKECDKTGYYPSLTGMKEFLSQNPRLHYSMVCWYVKSIFWNGIHISLYCTF